MDLVSALFADRGIACFVGAGGKKSTMYALAQRLDRPVVTATVRIPPFGGQVASLEVTEDPWGAIQSATAWPLGLVPATEGEDRYRGYDPAAIDAIADAPVDAILVKADGARMRRLKAPADHEPRIPRGTDTVIPIASAHVIGAPLEDDLVHRVDRVTALTGLDRGDTITPEAVAQVLVHPEGGRKGVPPGARFVPLVNMVDDDAHCQAARVVAEAIHRRADVPHVVLAAMRRPDPLVDVIGIPARF